MVYICKNCMYFHKVSLDGKCFSKCNGDLLEIKTIKVKEIIEMFENIGHDPIHEEFCSQEYIKYSDFWYIIENVFMIDENKKEK